MKGYFLVNKVRKNNFLIYFILNKKVPGNFHISAHAYGSIIQRLASEGVLQFDVAHKINHLSFGEDKDIKKIKEEFNLGELNPLDGVEKIEESRKVYEYYMKVNNLFFKIRLYLQLTLIYMGGLLMYINLPIIQMKFILI